MSVMTAELFRSAAIRAGEDRAPASRQLVAPIAPRLRPKRRSAHGTGRALGPVSRPVRAAPAPRLAPGARTRSRSCTAEAAPVRWRITDRGIAVVLVAGLMIVAAAAVVVTMTALRVTGEYYQPFQPSEVITSTQG